MATTPIRIQTTSGTVEGFTRGGVHRFRSIPYAEPPVGPLRLRAPRPVTPWQGVRKCRKWGAASWQQRKYAVILPGKYQKLSEDCLTLNVVAPDWPSSEPRPVMFFIHGGGYFLGSSATPLYDGASLARSGCVFVSVNYRLGGLGCLDLSSLSDANHRIDSNLYLRDLLLALQWVRDNIGAFGGDPNNVTIFGESAGAHAVNTLLAVPSAAGLFHRAICESTASGLVIRPEEAAANARKYAELLGANESNAAQTVLTAKPMDTVRALHRLIATAKDLPGLSLRIGASIDGDILPRDPLEAIESGDAHRVPLIVGFNAEEATLFTKIIRVLPLTPQGIETTLSAGGPELVSRIVGSYDGYPSQDACLKICSDMGFASAAWRVAEAHSRYAPTYFYRYDYATRALRRYGLGATHAIELLAVFGTYRTVAGPLLAGRKDRPAARAVSREMQDRWLEFARAGVPGERWPVYTVPDRRVMIFDYPIRVESDPDGDRRPMWQEQTAVV